MTAEDYKREQRAKAIAEGRNLNTDGFNEDGYTNMLNKYGTAQDNSTSYHWQSEHWADDLELIQMYEGNGLFSKIIDRPAEEAVKHGLDIDYGSEDIEEYVESRLDELDYEEKFTTAEKWARLYGGSIIVMLVDDGKGLEEPLDWNAVKSIEELRVFERSVVQPDYSQLGQFNFKDSAKNKAIAFGEPQYYQVFSMYGYFLVHRTRCLVFRNGRLPEQTTNSNYRYWGIPEYVKIRTALRECITSHEYGVKLLERSVQPIYKMKNLANLLASDDGENKAVQRLQVIDMARGILNSIAIDSEGEDYSFATTSLSGTNEIINTTCNLLSAETNIPQTVLFGRSPSGENATGDSDLENYYNMVENIQKQNMKKNVRTLIDLILKQGYLEGEIDSIPRYKVKFAALWSMSESEEIANEASKVATEKTKADMAIAYIDAGVLDATEVRNVLAREGNFDIEEVITDDGELELPEDALDIDLSTPMANAIAEVGNATDTDVGGKEGLSTEEDALPSLADTIAKNVVDMTEDEPKTLEDALLNVQEENPNNPTHEDVISESMLAKSLESNIIEVMNTDGKDLDKGVGVLVVKGNKILCGERTDTGEICGPGGHIQDDETTDEAAVRETKEEFGIEPIDICPLGQLEPRSEEYKPSTVYVTDAYKGEPTTDGVEMIKGRWLTLEELQKKKLHPAFKDSLDLLVEILKKPFTTEH